MTQLFVPERRPASGDACLTKATPPLGAATSWTAKATPEESLHDQSVNAPTPFDSAMTP